MGYGTKRAAHLSGIGLQLSGELSLQVGLLFLKLLQPSLQRLEALRTPRVLLAQHLNVVGKVSD